MRRAGVDLTAGRLAVRHAVNVIDGKEHVDTPKSRRSRRVIDLDPETVHLLGVHRLRQLGWLDRLDIGAPAR